jgi:hypothetical protein
MISQKAFFCLVDSEGWLGESELYSCAEDDFYTTFNNVLCNQSNTSLPEFPCGTHTKSSWKWIMIFGRKCVIIVYL